MNNKLKAILIIAVFAFICIGSYSIFEPAIHVSYERINLTQSCTAEVPVTDKSSEYVDNLGIEYYSDYEHNSAHCGGAFLFFMPVRADFENALSEMKLS